MKTKGKRQSKNVDDVRGSKREQDDKKAYKQHLKQEAREMGAKSQRQGNLTSKTPVKNQKKVKTIEDVINSIHEDDLPPYSSPRIKRKIKKDRLDREWGKLKRLKNHKDSYSPQKGFNSQVTPGKWETKGK